MDVDITKRALLYMVLIMVGVSIYLTVFTLNKIESFSEPQKASVNKAQVRLVIEEPNGELKKSSNSVANVVLNIEKEG